MRRTEAQRAATRDAVTSGANLTAAYLAMNASAALIAGFGLLENSPAVIIGAMLIAMLYGPIIGIALGLAEADLSLLGRSIVSEIAGAAWVWFIGLAVGMVTRKIPIGTEVLSRTSPNILDLLIALVAGLAGGFTYISTGLAGVVVGVAIATALVPPLMSCGILVARGIPGLASGAFLLFLANFTAIAVGAMFIFWLSGHRPSAADRTQRILIPRAISLALLAVLGIHLTLTLKRTVTQSVFESTMRKTLSDEVSKIPGARFVTVTLSERQGKTVALVVVRAPQPLSPPEVRRLNDVANKATERGVLLDVRSVITAETSPEGYLYEPKMVTADDR